MILWALLYVHILLRKGLFLPRRIWLRGPFAETDKRHFCFGSSCSAILECTTTVALVHPKIEKSQPKSPKVLWTTSEIDIGREKGLAEKEGPSLYWYCSTYILR